MNNKKNINKGWLIFLLTILFTSSLFNPNVKALELTEQETITNSEDIIEEDNLNTELEITETEEETNNYDNLQDEATDNEVFLEKTKEEIFTSISTNMDFQEKIVIIKGNIKEYTTVKEVIANINIEELNKYFPETTIGITNEEGTILNEDDYLIEKSSIFFINTEFISNYQINFLGDLNQDNLINESDLETGIDEYFKEEDNIEDKSITQEISYVDAIIKENTYEVETPNVEETLNVELKSTNNEDIYLEEEVIIKVDINGFNENYMNTISGTLEYDNEILELENIYFSIEGKVIGNIQNNKFIYILDNYNENKTILFITFKSLKSGSTDISIKDLKLIMNGTPLNIITNPNLDIIINEYGKGGDVETPPVIEIVPDNNQTNSNTTNTIEKSKNKTYPLKITTSTTNKKDITKPLVQLSNDNYIKNIEVTGYEIAFDKDTNYYQIEVDNNVDSLDLNITLNDKKSMYMITGNEQFKTGKNEIILTVQAEDGTTRDYIIEVNKKEEKINKEENKKEEKVTESKINIQLVLIIIMIIATIILIYKILRKED